MKDIADIVLAESSQAAATRAASSALKDHRLAAVMFLFFYKKPPRHFCVFVFILSLGCLALFAYFIDRSPRFPCSEQ